MCEILFRGQDVHGRWYCGLLSHIGNAWYISNSVGVPTAFEVIPKTIGQYTGLTDKNGTKIFEGDIAKFNRFRSDYVGKIVFNDKTAGFELWWSFIAGTYGEKATGRANLSVCDEIEVAGNIFDNPELLKGGADDA